MKLLKLRVEFRENAQPLAEDSTLDPSTFNQFKVPFRIAPNRKFEQSEGKVFLLKGDKNMNLDTE